MAFWTGSISSWHVRHPLRCVCSSAYGAFLRSHIVRLPSIWSPAPTHPESTECPPTGTAQVSPSSTVIPAATGTSAERRNCAVPVTPGLAVTAHAGRITVRCSTIEVSTRPCTSPLTCCGIHVTRHRVPGAISRCTSRHGTHSHRSRSISAWHCSPPFSHLIRFSSFTCLSMSTPEARSTAFSKSRHMK
jgi:hypothetical protein